MIEVIKDLSVGLVLCVTGVLVFVLAMWLLINVPHWVIVSAFVLFFAWCLGSLVRS